MAIKTVAQFSVGNNQAGFAYDTNTGTLVYIGFMVADQSYPIYVKYTNRATGKVWTAPDANGNEIVQVTGLTYNETTGATNFDGESGTR